MPGLLATASLDETVKVWDFRDNKPALLVTKPMQVGTVHCMSFDMDSAATIVAGGNSGKIAVWDMADDEQVSDRFGSHFKSFAESRRR